jgi:hypothetical protein
MQLCLCSLPLVAIGCSGTTRRLNEIGTPTYVTEVLRVQRHRTRYEIHQNLSLILVYILYVYLYDVKPRISAHRRHIPQPGSPTVTQARSPDPCQRSRKRPYSRRDKRKDQLLLDLLRVLASASLLAAVQLLYLLPLLAHAGPRAEESASTMGPLVGDSPCLRAFENPISRYHHPTSFDNRQPALLLPPPLLNFAPPHRSAAYPSCPQSDALLLFPHLPSPFPYPDD